MFEWGTINPSIGRNGGYCGHGDSLLQSPTPRRCFGENQKPPAELLPSNHSVARKAEANDESYPVYTRRMRNPFASGMLEVRSRALQALVDGCGDSREFARRWNADAHGGCEGVRQRCADDDFAVACDHASGYQVALCLHRHGSTRNVSMFHLPNGKAHVVARAKIHDVPPEPLVGPMSATTVLHPYKSERPPSDLGVVFPCAIRHSAFTPARALVADPQPPRGSGSWRWHLGDGLLPIPLIGSYAAPGQVAWALDPAVHARLRESGGVRGSTWEFWASPKRCNEKFPCGQVPPVEQMARRTSSRRRH